MAPQTCLGALIGCFGGRHAGLAKAIDVFENDDRRIHHHADGKGDTRQRNDIE